MGEGQLARRSKVSAQGSSMLSAKLSFRVSAVPAKTNPETSEAYTPSNFQPAALRDLARVPQSLKDYSIWSHPFRIRDQF